jgi:hypothetical protein
LNPAERKTLGLFGQQLPVLLPETLDNPESGEPCASPWIVERWSAIQRFREFDLIERTLDQMGNTTDFYTSIPLVFVFEACCVQEEPSTLLPKLMAWLKQMEEERELADRYHEAVLALINALHDTELNYRAFVRGNRVYHEATWLRATWMWGTLANVRVALANQRMQNARDFSDLFQAALTIVDPEDGEFTDTDFPDPAEVDFEKF